MSFVDVKLLWRKMSVGLRTGYFAARNINDMRPSNNSVKPRSVLRYLANSGGTPLTLTCNTCAYVVASGHMTNSASGSKIDANDCVFRSNDSPTTGYERDVGEKTTIRIVYVRSLRNIQKLIRLKEPFDKYYANMTFVILGTLSLKPLSDLIHEMKTTYPGMKFTTAEANFSRYIDEVYKANVEHKWPIKNLWLSSGFSVILIMKGLCSNITIYGMPYPNYCKEKGTRNVKYHYYSKNDQMECDHYAKFGNVHRFVKEKVAFQKWRRAWGNIEFQNPSWPNHITKSNSRDPTN